MARLIASKAEKALPSYLDWDDASLGRFCRHVALTLDNIKDDATGLRRITSAANAMMLVGMAVEANATTMQLDLSGHTHGGEPTGDWVVTIKRVKRP